MVEFATQQASLSLAKLGSSERALHGGRLMGHCLVESFGGISGARRALEVLGITPGLHLHLETNEECCRVSKEQYPDVQMLGAVEQLTEFSLRKFSDQAINVTHVCISVGHHAKM